MGDRRFDAAYKAVADSSDRSAAIRQLDDEEIIHALAAASRKMDAYLANVLAVEVLNRRRRNRALAWGWVVGLGLAVLLRSIIFFLSGDRGLVLRSLGAFIPAGLAGVATYVLLLRRTR